MKFINTIVYIPESIRRRRYVQIEIVNNYYVKIVDTNMFYFCSNKSFNNLIKLCKQYYYDKIDMVNY